MTSVSSTINRRQLSPFSESDCAADSASPRLIINGPRFPLATPVPFHHFNNKYQGGTCYIVGRGPTLFDYKDLAEICDPIFFINDAVCLENCARSETFFFAHDIEMRVWLDGSIKATAVLPIEGTILGDAPDIVLNHASPLVYYHRGDQNKAELLRLSRDELADRQELYVQSGTIHSLLHFVWFCGFSRVIYIGCDGINRKYALARTCGSEDGYDPRLQNKSHTSPWWHYKTIRRAQDLLTALFGIEATYLGTPVC